LIQCCSALVYKYERATETLTLPFPHSRQRHLPPLFSSPTHPRQIPIQDPPRARSRSRALPAPDLDPGPSSRSPTLSLSLALGEEKDGQRAVRELAEDSYSGVEVLVTPMRTDIIIQATRTQIILGEKGRGIRELTSIVQKRFIFPENGVALYAEKVVNRGICAIA
jgi:small subunit ribosomal protein S3e